MHLVDGGKELVQWSERDGWAHLYLYDGEGNLKNQITSGPWHCGNIVKVDSRNRVLYFTANVREKGENPYYDHLYKVNLDGSNLTILNKGDFTSRTNISDSDRYFINNFSKVNTAPKSIPLG